MLLALLLFCSCYQQPTGTSDACVEEKSDSISFYSTYHYTVNFPFVVRADSLHIIVQQPSEVVSGMLVDSIAVMRHDRLVVADVLMMPADTVDSVWIEVVSDALTSGWIHESSLLGGVSPDNPISQFIDFFSDRHQLIIAAILILVVAVLVVARLMHRRAPMVLFNDIDTFYPSLLSILVSLASALFTTIQTVEPESWRHYYYHPTLNPFVTPLLIAFFVITMWGILIVLIATVGDVQRRLSASKALIYYVSLSGICALGYIVFGIATYYYIGYPLLVVYIAFALWRYYRYSRSRYKCGHCGARLRQKGVCPYCGTHNV